VPEADPGVNRGEVREVDVLTAERVPAAAAPARRRADLDVLCAAAPSLPALALPVTEFEVLHGGLTNHNYRVRDARGARLMARFWSREAAELSIDREAEFRNATIAADAGIAPRILGHSPEHGVTLVEWIDGRTFASADLDDSANLGRVAAACAALHAGPRFVADFDMFTIQSRYRAIVGERGFRIPEHYDRYLGRVDEVRSALAVDQVDTVPCHNDLLAANIMDTGDRLWLIDFEYSGNNDPFFELGNLWAEAELAPSRLEDLVTAYVGRPAPSKVARARLFAVLAQYGWTLWAAIQSAVSEVDFDFWSWGMAKYERARQTFDGPEFTQLIYDVTQTD
jgi:thiamine kinase-like enzyme